MKKHLIEILHQEEMTEDNLLSVTGGVSENPAIGQDCFIQIIDEYQD